MPDRTAIKPPSWLKDMNAGLLEQQRCGTLEFDLPVLVEAAGICPVFRVEGDA